MRIALILAGFVSVGSLWSSSAVRAQDVDWPTWEATFKRVTSDELEVVRARKDAEADHKQGKCQIYAVRGYSYDFPDSGLDIVEVAERKIPVILIEDTLDYAFDNKQIAVNYLSRLYSKQYNMYMRRECGWSASKLPSSNE